MLLKLEVSDTRGMQYTELLLECKHSAGHILCLGWHCNSTCDSMCDSICDSICDGSCDSTCDSTCDSMCESSCDSSSDNTGNSIHGGTCDST